MFQFPVPVTDWSLILPFVMVVLTGISALVLEIVAPKRDNSLIVILSVFGLFLTGGLVAVQFVAPATTSFGGMLLRDPLSLASQITLVVVGILVILFSEPYLREKRIPFGEFYPLLLWSISGAMLMVSTSNLLLIFVGLEILSISLYVMAGISRSEEKSEESAMKYFLLGAFASAFLLYGIALLYGSSGSLDLSAISAAWAGGKADVRTLVVFSLALLLIGLGFKSSFFPFHQWTPDVYQGAPTNVGAYMATGSKIAAFVVMFRLLGYASDLKAYWLPVLSVIAGLTMLYGNLVALRQTDVKRILGYSSIGHAGYILVAILAHGVAPSQVGPNTLIYYMLAYSVSTVGAFAVIALAARDGEETTSVENLNGLFRRSPAAAASLVIFMASLMGIPLTGGFLGKALIFGDAMQAGLMPLAIILAVSSIISVSFYLRIAYAAVVPNDEQAITRLAPVRPALQSAFLLCAAAVFGTFLFFGPLITALGDKVVGVR